GRGVRRRWAGRRACGSAAPRGPASASARWARPRSSFTRSGRRYTSTIPARAGPQRCTDMKLRGGERTIGVGDLAEAKEFFVDALGLKVLSDADGTLVLDAGARLTVKQGPSGG